MPPRNDTGVEQEATSSPASASSPESQLRPAASDAAGTQSTATPTSADPQEQRNPNDWFRASFNRVRYGAPIVQEEASAAPEAKPESEASDGQDAGADQAKAADDASPAPKATASPDEDTIVLTKAEFQRKVQAEKDRELAKHQREEAERRKREDRKKLRETDPYAFAKQDAEDEAQAATLQEQLQQAQTMTLSAMHAYDASVLDPLMKAVPDADRRKILDAIEPGIPGRGQAAEQALKVLQKHWHDQGVASARKTLLSDQAFVKEVLAKYGGQRIEPDMVPAAAGPANRPFNVNDSLRAAGRVALSRA